MRHQFLNAAIIFSIGFFAGAKCFTTFQKALEYGVMGFIAFWIGIGLYSGIAFLCIKMNSNEHKSINSK